MVVSGHCHPNRASSDLHSVKEDSVDLSVPLHAQLRDALIEQIVSGVLRAGSRIPSERELCKQYNVSRTTARRTLSECVHEGWLYTVVGKGTYVSQHHLEQELRSFTGFSDDLRKRGIVPTSRVLAAENLKASSSLADKLRLLPQAPVLRLIRVRMASGKPIAIQETYLPEHLCPGLFRFDFASRSLYEVLREEYGLRLVRSDTKIKAALATVSERQTLQLADPSAVLRTSHTTYLKDDRSIEYCESVFHGDMYELTFAATA